MASYDRNVVNSFARAADVAKARPIVRQALFEAGLVESGLRNLNYGDRDSLGALQQRPSQGWRHATNPYLGALDFIHAADKVLAGGFHGTPGQLAQAVQRSAFPGRYDQQAGKASSILAAISTGGRHQGLIPPGSGSDLGAGAIASAPSLQDSTSSPDPSGLLQALAHSQQQGPAMSPIAPPAFAAAPKLPAGAQPLGPTQSPGPAGPSVSDLLAAISAPNGGGATLVPGQATGNAQNGSGVTHTSGKAGHSVAGAKGSIFELIHNDGGRGYGIKNGQVVNGSQVFSGVWAGHANHVHVAADPRTIIALGGLAQSMGLHVGENPYYGGESPSAHVPNSFHDRIQTVTVNGKRVRVGEAIDVFGDPGKMNAYARAVELYNRTGRLP